MMTVRFFMCFSVFVYIHAHFCFVPIGENLTAQLTGSQWAGELEAKFEFQSLCCKLIVFLQRGKI